jgi:SAM-dependent methyltransferase
VSRAIYDERAGDYARTRQADPRIAAAIEEALADAATVVNVGAGTGSYEPRGRRVTAVEPSAEMIAQRPPGAAPAVRAGAEALPFPDDSFDAAMAVLTVHHWPDLDRGLAELRRVARDRIVLVTFDPGPLRGFWLVRDYFPAIVGLHADRISSSGLAEKLPAAGASSIPVPRDCSDLFFAALWGRPELLLDPAVVRPLWVLEKLPEAVRREGLQRLAADLESGAWDERHGHLRAEAEFDVGLRLVVSELAEG